MALARTVGRYEISEPFAAGGMATVHAARLHGPGGFRRVVAAKRLHADLAHDPAFVATLLDEARLSARIRSVHVVPVTDVVRDGAELLLVMDYIDGVPLSAVMDARPSPAVAVAIVRDVLAGLGAAHEARTENGERLALVHRDVSPQNVIVGSDGLARLLDFGVAFALGRSQSTRDGQRKGKLAYMSPEQLADDDVDLRTDLHAAAMLLWELLAGRPLRPRTSSASWMQWAHSPSPRLPEAGALADVLDRALAVAPSARFASAGEMTRAIVEAQAPAAAAEVATWIAGAAPAVLAERRAIVAAAEQAPTPAPAADGTTLSRTTAEAPAAPRTGRRRLALALVTLAALAGGFALGRATPPAAVEAAPLPRLAPSVAAPATTAPDSHAAETPAVPSAQPAPSAANTSSAVAARTVAPGPTAPRARAARPASSSAPRPACDPPYVLDARGVRTYREECL